MDDFTRRTFRAPHRIKKLATEWKPSEVLLSTKRTSVTKGSEEDVPARDDLGLPEDTAQIGRTNKYGLRVRRDSCGLICE